MTGDPSPPRDQEGRLHAGKRCRARKWTARGPFCETWPMNHVVADRDRHDLCRRRQRVVRPGGVEVHRPRRNLEPFEQRPGLRRGRDAINRLEPRRRATAAYTPVSSRPGCSPATTAGETWTHVAGLREHPTAAEVEAGRSRADPPFDRLHPDDTRPALGRYFRGRRVPYRRRRRTWEPRTGAPAATTCRRRSAIPNSASACTASPWRRAAGPAVSAEPLRHVSQRQRRPALGEHRSGTALQLRLSRVAHPRDPSTVSSAAAERRHRNGPLCADGKAAVWRTRDGGAHGRRCATACRSRTPSSACCARRWRPTA